MSKIWRSLLAAVCLCATPALADVWDTQTDNDDDPGAENELVHGTIQVHDLGVRPGPVADQDWFRIPQKPHASYEVIVDGVSGDLVPGLTLDRVLVFGGTIAVQSSAPAVQGSAGFSRALRWANTTTSTVTSQRIRVTGGTCGIDCGSNDVYSLRVRETTVYIARFNTSGTIQTFLHLQNTSERPVDATAYCWSLSGSLIAAVPFGIEPRGASGVLVNFFVPGVHGHVTIAHDGGWGALNAKTTSIDLETGISFDVQGVSLP